MKPGVKAAADDADSKLLVTHVGSPNQLIVVV
jgi:hypothetical protein